jgi:NAD-dependent SIR2 family protein deacetylase
MASNVKVEKTVFNITEFNKVVDTKFNTFVQPPTGSAINNIDEFFRMYEDLYYVIDVTGPTNSHEYLVRKSSELLDFDVTTQNIQPLLDEIAQLRQVNLGLNQQLLDLQTTV